MRKHTGPILIAAVALAAPGALFARAAVSQPADSLELFPSPFTATVMCRPEVTGDSAAGMAAMHETSMKNVEGGAMVCKSMTPVKVAMAKTATAAKSASSAPAANTIWITFLNGQMVIPLPPR